MQPLCTQAVVGNKCFTFLFTQTISWKTKLDFHLNAKEEKREPLLTK